MRQGLLIVGTIVVIAIAFTAYVLLQTPPPAGGTVFTPVDAPPPPGSDHIVSQTLHKGTNAFMKSYDSKTHQLANQFRADTYDPKPDGTIDMTNPEAEFFLGGGQMLRINGETGNVVDPNSAGGKLQGQSQTPSRGKMQHVILRLFKAVNDKEPQFTCWVNNLAFDNDTTTIATEDCDIPDSQGNLVPTAADQVPVHVIGIDYDFDGRGLTIKWNERDRHLERLEIAHGEQLIIKHPGALNVDSKSTTQPATQPASPVASSQLNGPLRDDDGPIALVSASPDAGVSAAATPATKPVKKKKRKPATKPVPPPTSAPVIHRAKDAGVYRATFYDNVHVTQLDQTLATADLMNVDFFMNNGHATTEPTTEPTGEPSTQSVIPPAAAAGFEAAAEDAGQAAQDVAPRKAPKRSAAGDANRTPAPPSTQPDIPVIVRWTGKLVVTPPDADVPPLVAGDSVLQMIGNTTPVVLNQKGSLVHCASFRYHTLDESVAINSSEALPIVTVLQSNGTKVFAPSITYDGPSKTATIPGRAHAEFPVASNNAATTQPGAQPTTRATQIAKADWSDSCTLVLNDDKQVTEALLDGDVHVDHPQVKMIADELDLGLDNTPRPNVKTPTTQSSDSVTTAGQLREMNAAGSVDCTLHDSQGKPQRIIAQHLTLNTKRISTGEDVPSELTADGQVHTYDSTQDLWSEHLVAELEPSAVATTRPVGGDVQLRELRANQNVHFLAKDGSFADSEQLYVETIKPASPGVPANQEIELMGVPDARVGDKQNTITGPLIHYNPGTKQAHVIGPGTIHGVQQLLPDPTHPAPTSRPVDVTWQKSFSLDGVGNHVKIIGNVHTRSVSADGTVNSAIGDRVLMTLADAPPTTSPTTSPTTASAISATSAPAVAAATRPTSTPSMLIGGGDTNFMKDKVVDTATLLGNGNENVEVSSIARDQAGKILHAMNLFAPTAIYDKTHDTFTVPVPGRMLVRDFRSTAPTTGPTDSSAGGMRGTSAFQWEKSLVYNQRADQAIMTGDVQVVHEAAGAASYQMFADKITADLEPSPHPTTAPTTSPGGSLAKGLSTATTNTSLAQATTSPATQPSASGEDSMKVKRLVAEGQVRMVSQKLGFIASEAVYDPETQIMTAHGSPREPAQLLDEQGLSTGSFDDLVYNTATDQVVLTEFHGNMRK
jgi:lipopolysaccharide export system protein LptA